MVEEKDQNVEQVAESAQSDSADFSDELVIYELGYHLIPTLSDEQVEKEQADIKALVEKLGGVFISESAPKRMQLAYTMIKKVESKGTKFDQTYFGWIKFEMLPRVNTELKKEIDLHENILRYIVVKTIREHAPVRERPVIFKAPESEKIPDKVVVKTKETGESKPVSDEELDKSIEELVAG